MSRSLAHVALLATLTVGGPAMGLAQTAAAPATTAGATVKNHISDAERDRLMQEAMDKARLELEKSKAEREATEQVKSEREERAKKEAAAAKVAAEKAEEAAAARKADEERMARELAEAEKKSSDKTRELEPIKNLDTVKADEEKSEPVKKTESAEKSEPVKKTETVASRSSSESKSETRKETAKKTSSSDRKSDDESSTKKESDTPTRTVIETVSTREPGSKISVKKTSLPAGDEAREAEQRAARAAGGSGSSRGESSSSDSQSYSGQVVGLMRSSDGQAKILLQSEDHRMVQVMLGDDEVPAPGSVVSVRGRAIGGSSVSPVISATSIDIKSGQKVEPLREITAPQVPAMDVPPMIHPEPIMMGPGPMMGPPMPMGMGMGMGPMGPVHGFGGPGPF